ncbi:hypothetical protein [Streptomyces antimycoticus]|uniref:hypothetical protein n=1 Tax=Streptomyces antimycoticus TaxID=68175 RepID=UPI0033E10F8B|nr:hypothetical protein OG751_00110 [Streptomyces antimycoticus]WTA86852.1 hypothetical protein OG751_47675 [Streptomyces antimycoticus]
MLVPVSVAPRLAAFAEVLAWSESAVAITMRSTSLLGAVPRWWACDRGDYRTTPRFWRAAQGTPQSVLTRMLFIGAS